MQLTVNSEECLQYGASMAMVLAYCRVNKEATIKDIACDLGICQDMARRYLKGLERSGRLKRVIVGHAIVGADVYD